jgi:hypothetical protein
LEGHTLIALLTVQGIHHLTESLTLLHMQPILMVPLALAEDLAEAEDLAGVEAWEEDGGKLNNWALGAFLEYLPRLLPCHRRVHCERRRTLFLAEEEFECKVAVF